MSVIRLPSITLEFEGGILFVRAVPGQSHSAADAREAIEAGRELVGDRRVPTLSYMQGVGALDRDVRDVYRYELDYLEVHALLVGSAFSRLVGSIYIRVARPEVETRLFTDEAEALRWLRPFIDSCGSTTRRPGGPAED